MRWKASGLVPAFLEAQRRSPEFRGQGAYLGHLEGPPRQFRKSPNTSEPWTLSPFYWGKTERKTFSFKPLLHLWLGVLHMFTCSSTTTTTISRALWSSRMKLCPSYTPTAYPLWTLHSTFCLRVSLFWEPYISRIINTLAFVSGLCHKHIFTFHACCL